MFFCVMIAQKIGGEYARMENEQPGKVAREKQHEDQGICKAHRVLKTNSMEAQKRWGGVS